MTINHRRLVSSRMFILGLAFTLFCGLNAIGVASASANGKTQAKQLVEKSKLTFENFASAKEMGSFRKLVKKAKGIFISPEMLKGAFLVGVSGGSGVFLARNNKREGWSDPAFYTIGGASFGLQAGGQSAEVVILAMTERGVNAFLNSSLKLGAGVSLAAGPVGAGASAATQNLSADLISFTRAKGLFGGISVNGAVVKVRNGWNEAYYGGKVSPREILITEKASNPQAAGLLAKVARTAGK